MSNPNKSLVGGTTPPHPSVQHIPSLQRILMYAGTSIRRVQELSDVNDVWREAVTQFSSHIWRKLMDARHKTHGNQGTDTQLLFMACERGWSAVLEYFLMTSAIHNEPFDPNQLDPLRHASYNYRGLSLLHTCMFHNRSAKCARLLLEIGADRELEDRHGDTPLVTACMHNAAECAELLFTIRPLSNRQLRKAGVLTVAMPQQPSQDDDDEDEEEVDPNDNRSQYLLEQKRKRREQEEEEERKLAAAPLRVNVNYFQDPDRLCITDVVCPLQLACGKVSPKIAALILQQPGVNVNLRRTDACLTPLMLAAKHGQSSTVQLLLQHPGINPHATDLDGNTALIYAAQAGCTKSVEALLHAGCSTTQRNKSGKTAMDFARGNARGGARIVETIRKTVERMAHEGDDDYDEEEEYDDDDQDDYDDEYCGGGKKVGGSRKQSKGPARKQSYDDFDY